MRAIIIGGGIGGLTAAIALLRLGIEAAVYERTPMLGDVGAGIGLSPNAVKVLRKLCLGDRLQSISLANMDGALRRWNGAYISQTSAREFERPFGSGMIVVHRAELLDMLAESAGQANIHLSHDFSSVEHNACQVRAHFTNGATTAGDFLVGADGLRSRVRVQLGRVDSIRYAGYNCLALRRTVPPFRGRSRRDVGPGKTFRNVSHSR
jgi:salicylate hydroxylase